MTGEPLTPPRDALIAENEKLREMYRLRTEVLGETLDRSGERMFRIMELEAKSERLEGALRALVAALMESPVWADWELAPEVQDARALAESTPNG